MAIAWTCTRLQSLLSKGGKIPQQQYHELQVTFLGASNQYEVCQEAKPVNSQAGIQFDCLEPRHFQPEVIETYPYEQLSHAALAWLVENADRCDVVHAHEWGGAFVDVITAAHYLQVQAHCPGGACAQIPFHT